MNTVFDRSGLQCGFDFFVKAVTVELIFLHKCFVISAFRKLVIDTDSDNPARAAAGGDLCDQSAKTCNNVMLFRCENQIMLFKNLNDTFFIARFDRTDVNDSQINIFFFQLVSRFQSGLYTYAGCEDRNV